MILTDYYKFKRVATKSRSRMDCIASTQGYPAFEAKRVKGTLAAYYTDMPNNFRDRACRRADKIFNMRGENITSIYTPDLESASAYGDVKGTKDALLFVFKDLNTVNGIIQPDGEIEVFVARGKSNARIVLWNLLSDGDLDEEMNTLRAAATPEEKAVEADSLY